MLSGSCQLYAVLLDEMVQAPDLGSDCRSRVIAAFTMDSLVAAGMMPLLRLSPRNRLREALVAEGLSDVMPNPAAKQEKLRLSMWRALFRVP